MPNDQKRYTDELKAFDEALRKLPKAKRDAMAKAAREGGYSPEAVFSAAPSEVSEQAKSFRSRSADEARLRGDDWAELHQAESVRLGLTALGGADESAEEVVVATEPDAKPVEKTAETKADADAKPEPKPETKPDGGKPKGGEKNQANAGR